MSEAQSSGIASFPLSADRRMARVLRAENGQALEVLVGTRPVAVVGHLDTVTFLQPGDTVIVELLGNDALIHGRLRRPDEPPATRVFRDERGRLVLENRAGVVLRASDCTVELTPDGRVLIEGEEVHSMARGIHSLQGSTVRVN